jgi:streptogramin lyase
MARGHDGALWLLDNGRTVTRWKPGHRARRITRGFGRRRDLLTITAGTAGRMWVTDQNGAILAISRRGHVRRYTRGLGRRPEPTAIAHGPDGNMWFTMFSRRRVGRITPSGNIRLWRTRESPASIVQGPDGALWFTTAAVSLDDTINGLGRIDVRGRLQEFFVRPSFSTGFQALATGPDGKLWFVVDRGPVAIARMDPTRVAEIGALR